MTIIPFFIENKMQSFYSELSTMFIYMWRLLITVSSFIIKFWSCFKAIASSGYDSTETNIGLVSLKEEDRSKLSLWIL